MIGRVPYSVFRDGIYAHPFAEGLNGLFTGPLVEPGGDRAAH